VRWSDYQLVVGLNLLAARTPFKILCLHLDRTAVTKFGSHRGLQLFQGQEGARRCVKAGKSNHFIGECRRLYLGCTREAYGYKTKTSKPPLNFLRLPFSGTCFNIPRVSSTNRFNALTSISETIEIGDCSRSTTLPVAFGPVAGRNRPRPHANMIVVLWWGSSKRVSIPWERRSLEDRMHHSC